MLVFNKIEKSFQEMLSLMCAVQWNGGEKVCLMIVTSLAFNVLLRASSVYILPNIYSHIYQLLLQLDATSFSQTSLALLYIAFMAIKNSI